VTATQEAGIDRKFAKTVGISVDHRRTNKCTESLKLNVARLAEYKERLVIFPRRLGKVKKGDSDKATIADVQQLQGPIIALPPKTGEIEYVEVTEVGFNCNVHYKLH
jgi:large subunit ribosomal protein L13e